MEKDNLSSEKLKSKHKYALIVVLSSKQTFITKFIFSVFSLTGAYRRVFIKPENFSWKFMKYQKYDDDLILSDISRIYNDPEPKDNPDGEVIRSFVK